MSSTVARRGGCECQAEEQAGGEWVRGRGAGGTHGEL